VVDRDVARLQTSGSCDSDWTASQSRADLMYQDIQMAGQVWRDAAGRPRAFIIPKTAGSNFNQCLAPQPGKIQRQRSHRGRTGNSSKRKGPLFEPNGKPCGSLRDVQFARIHILFAGGDLSG
jgi:hypothetical protein